MRVGRLIRAPLLALLALLLALDLTFVATVIAKNQVAPDDWVAWAFVGRRLAFDLAAWVALGGLGLRLGRALASRQPRLAAVPLALVAWGWALATLADLGIYWYGNTLFERVHLRLIASYSLGAFLTPLTGLLVALALGLAWGGWWLARAALAVPGAASPGRWARLGRWLAPLAGALAASGLYALDLGALVTRVKTEDARYDRHIFQFRNQQLAYALQCSPCNLARELLASPRHDALRVSPLTEELAAAGRRLGLSLGARRDPPLPGLGGFEHVVLLTVESLSADLIGAHNPALPIDPTPFFLSRPEIAGRTYTAFRGSAQPTLQGLAVLFTGQPNYQIEVDPHSYRTTFEASVLAYRNSFVHQLRAAGYRTVFLRSASAYYAHENVIFTHLGFERLIAREDFWARPALRPNVYGWGAKDRLVYDELVALLAANRGQRLFVTVLGTDTHPPVGEERFPHLRYPPLPPAFMETYGRDAGRFLAAIYRQDYELARLWEALQAAGLASERLLLIVTADHAVPYNWVVKAIPGYPAGSLVRVPLIFLSGAPLPEPPPNRALLASQIDLAPTLFHLLGLPRLAGWWGESLLLPGRRPLAVGYDQRLLRIDGGSWQQVFDFNRAQSVPADVRALFDAVIR